MLNRLTGDTRTHRTEKITKRTHDDPRRLENLDDVGPLRDSMCDCNDLESTASRVAFPFSALPSAFILHFESGSKVALLALSLDVLSRMTATYHTRSRYIEYNVEFAVLRRGVTGELQPG